MRYSDNSVVLSVYFQGAGFDINHSNTHLVAQFYENTEAHDLTAEDASIENSEIKNQFTHFIELKIF